MLHIFCYDGCVCLAAQLLDILGHGVPCCSHLQVCGSSLMDEVEHNATGKEGLFAQGAMKSFRPARAEWRKSDT